MKTIIIFISFWIFSDISYGQHMLTSGEYDHNLKIAYDNRTKQITGFFEDYTGFDEQTQNPKFSCIFYIEGRMTERKIKINTYYPKQKSNDLIEGSLEIINNKTIWIKLPLEQGGCWNVFHFADTAQQFSLVKETDWIQIRYVNTDKAFFYNNKTDSHHLKSYLLKGDIVYIEKIEDNRGYCIYYGKKKTMGWLKLSDLNKL